MKVGQLRHRITVQQKVQSQSESGATTWTWVDWKTVWSGIRPAAGSKYFAAKQIQSGSTHSIEVRYQSGFRTDMRIVYEKEPGLFQHFEIIDVVEEGERRTRLFLMCRLHEADGFRGEK